MTLLAILVLLDSAAPVTVVGPIANDPTGEAFFRACTSVRAELSPVLEAAFPACGHDSVDHNLLQPLLRQPAHRHTNLSVSVRHAVTAQFDAEKSHCHVTSLLSRARRSLYMSQCIHGSPTIYILQAQAVLIVGSQTRRDWPSRINVQGKLLFAWLTIRSQWTRSHTGEGGAIVMHGRSTVGIIGSTFLLNVAEVGGGALYIRDNSTVSIVNSVFDRNMGGNAAGTNGGGGAICIDGHSSVDITHSSFSGNSALVGGAIAIRGDNAVSVARSLFVGNTAGSGGAVSMSGSGRISITSTEFYQNGATGGKGAVMLLLSGTVALRDSLLASSVCKSVDCAVAATNKAVSPCTMQVYAHALVAFDNVSFADNVGMRRVNCLDAGSRRTIKISGFNETCL